MHVALDGSMACVEMFFVYKGDRPFCALAFKTLLPKYSYVVMLIYFVDQGSIGTSHLFCNIIKPSYSSLCGSKYCERK